MAGAIIALVRDSVDFGLLQRLGLRGGRPHNGRMDNPDPTRGFQFPGTFEVSAMGAADAGLECLLPMVLASLGLAVDLSSLRQRASAKGNYIAVAITFDAASRDEYDAAHAALRACPEVKWTI